jgi:hypothetical protein
MSKKLTEEQLAILNDSYPVEDESTRLQLPRFGMLSKDIIEETGTGKNKKIKVVEAAGTFFTERDLGEVNEDGKKVWTKTFIEGETVEVIIAYHRRQLRKFDSSLEKYISSPIYDNADQVIPLYLDKQIIKRGTQAELQALYPALTQKGKPTSDLKEECILYVVYNNELYQMNISQSSKWEFKTYSRGLNPSTVVTVIGSVEDTFGTNTYRKMTFKNDRPINSDEFEIVAESQGAIKEVVKSDEKFYLGDAPAMTAIEADMKQAAKNF